MTPQISDPLETSVAFGEVVYQREIVVRTYRWDITPTVALAAFVTWAAENNHVVDERSVQVKIKAEMVDVRLEDGSLMTLRTPTWVASVDVYKYVAPEHRATVSHFAACGWTNLRVPVARVLSLAEGAA